MRTVPMTLVARVVYQAIEGGGMTLSQVEARVRQHFGRGTEAVTRAALEQLERDGDVRLELGRYEVVESDARRAIKDMRKGRLSRR
jgi:hypothetical protein